MKNNFGKIILDDNEYDYIVEIKKIRNIYIRIKDNIICVSAPKFIKNEYIKELIIKKKNWIINQFKKEKEIINKELKNKKYLDEEFENIIIDYVKKYSLAMQVYPNKIRIKKIKYAWGSCTSKKNITFNSELIYYDKNVIEYVIVHELAHLKYMNHQKEFWKLVEKYIPNYKEMRKKLKYKN